MRKPAVLVAAAAALVGLAWGPATAQDRPKPVTTQEQPDQGQPDQGRRQQAVAQRFAVATRIIEAREAVSRKGPLASSYKRDWIERLSRLSMEQLLAISGRGPSANLAELYRQAAVSGPAADGPAPDFGDTTADLAYTQIAPCRVADTRVVTSPLASHETRPFHMTGTNDAWFTAQGGHQCGIPLGATGVAINLTVTGPTGTGWLRMYLYGGSGNASVINFARNTTIANGLLVPVCDWAGGGCDYDVQVAADAAGTHVLIDVLGYFTAPTRLGTLKSFTVTANHAVQTALPEDDTCLSYFSASITVPGPGQIKADAKVMARITHITGTESLMSFGIKTAPDDCDLDETRYGASDIPANWPSTPGYYPQATSSLLFEAPAAGTYWFYVNALKNSGAGSQYMWFGSMDLTYHPQ